MSEFRESAYYSFMADNIKPVHLALPLTPEQMDEVSLSAVPKSRTAETLAQIYRIQQSFPFHAVWRIVLLSLLGIIITYAWIMLIMLALFNVVLVLIAVGLQVEYIRWSINKVRKQQARINVKRMGKWLEAENKNYYCRKLIRWVYEEDSHSIVVHNLRSCF